MIPVSVFELNIAPTWSDTASAKSDTCDAGILMSTLDALVTLPFASTATCATLFASP